MDTITRCEHCGFPLYNIGHEEGGRLVCETRGCVNDRKRVEQQDMTGDQLRAEFDMLEEQDDDATLDRREAIAREIKDRNV